MLRKWLIVLGAFVLADVGGLVLHEGGHALNLVATGGQMGRIEVAPLRGSGLCVIPEYYREPMAVYWGGFLWHVVVSLVAFLVLWVIKSRLSFWGMMLAGVALVSSGTYMLGGTLWDYGDPAFLMGRGISRTALLVLGGSLIVLSVPVLLPAGALLGVGRGRCSIFRTMLVFATPILLYLAVQTVYGAVGAPGEWAKWLPMAGIAAGAAVVLVIVVHFSAAWTTGPETKRRAVRVGWPAAIASPALAGVVMVAAMLCFPVKPPSELYTAAISGDLEKAKQAIANVDESQFMDSRLATFEIGKLGLAVVPELIERMKSASGDIQWIPRIPPRGEESPRFGVQGCIKLILLRDYRKRHPECKVVAFPTMDNSLQLLRWWETEGRKVSGDEPYPLPRFMTPINSNDNVTEVLESEKYTEMMKHIRAENARFKKMGYETINEMTKATTKPE